MLRLNGFGAEFASKFSGSKAQDISSSSSVSVLKRLMRCQNAHQIFKSKLLRKKCLPQRLGKHEYFLAFPLAKH